MKEIGDEFVAVAALLDVPVGGGKVVKRSGKQIALIRPDEGCVYAIDNRCPHEGYPLSEGTVKDGVLTCDWHNWKFELKTGACLRGGEDVRTYPLCVREGEIFIDLRDKDAALLLPQAERSFIEAIEERDLGRVSRDALRLLSLGKKPEELIGEAARWASRRLEWGWDHGLTTAFECVRALPLYEGVKAVIPVTTAVAAVTDRALRMPVRVCPEPAADVLSLEEAKRVFADALEAEEHARAEAVFRRALLLGLLPGEARAWLFAAATEHFLSYGHGLIYSLRALQMLDQIGWQYAGDFLPSLVFQLSWGTREDRLPYMRKFRARLKRVLPELPRWFEKQRTASKEGVWEGEQAALEKILDGSMEEGFEAVAAALEEGIHFDRIVSVISVAAAERLLRFDVRIDRSVDREEGWLDVTHLLTYSNAARGAYALAPCEELLRALFYGAWFVQYVRHLDEPAEQRKPFPEVSARLAAEDLLSLLRTAIDERAADMAVSYCRKYLEAGHDSGPLQAELLRYAIEDSAVADIMIAHTIKTTAAAIQEMEAIGGEKRYWPVLSAVRFLASPKRERWVYRNARMAIRLAL